MAVKASIVAQGAGIVYWCYGVATSRELMRANEAALANPEVLRGMCFGLVDQTDVTEFDYGTTELRLVAEQDRKVAEFVAQGFLVAVVAPTDVGFGYSRMWQSIAEVTGWETLVVRTRAEADAWIHKRAKQKFGLELPPFEHHTEKAV